jgi:hypothetical protein
MITLMPTKARPPQRYRLRHLVHRTGDVTVATDLGVPRSTARGWLGVAPTVVVCLDVADLREPELRQEIHGELLKLGFDVSERSVARHLRRVPRRGDPATRWSAFLANHREAIVACDFFTVPTLTFQRLSCFFVIEHRRRTILHFNATREPTAAWVVQQLRDVGALDFWSLQRRRSRSGGLRLPSRTQEVSFIFCAAPGSDYTQPRNCGVQSEDPAVQNCRVRVAPRDIVDCPHRSSVPGRKNLRFSTRSNFGGDRSTVNDASTRSNCEELLPSRPPVTT